MAGRTREANRQYNLKQKGFFPELFDACLELQGGVCAICRQDAPSAKDGRRAWNADHCHATKSPRGVLCLHCNVALGHYESWQRKNLRIEPYEIYLDNPPAKQLGY